MNDICEGSKSQIKRHESPLSGQHQSKTNTTITNFIVNTDGHLSQGIH